MTRFKFTFSLLSTFGFDLTRLPKLRRPSVHEKRHITASNTVESRGVQVFTHFKIGSVALDKLMLFYSDKVENIQNSGIYNERKSQVLTLVATIIIQFQPVLVSKLNRRREWKGFIKLNHS